MSQNDCISRGKEERILMTRIYNIRFICLEIYYCGPTSVNNFVSSFPLQSFSDARQLKKHFIQVKRVNIQMLQNNLFRYQISEIRSYLYVLL